MTAPDRLVVEGLGRLREFAHAGWTDDTLFVSGTLGTEAGLELAGVGVAAQTTQALHNIGRILEAAGASWRDVVKVTVYLADMADFAAMNDAYGEFLIAALPYLSDPPARMTVGDVGLALGARVEIECAARHRRSERPTIALVRRTGFVDHEGESLYYEVVGQGGVPLVLSHGAGGNHAVWYQQVAALARDRTVVTWDHRGYGRSSDRADSSGPEVAAGDLLAILDHLGISRADLVGQSMGGWTIVGAALARPGVARCLVLADSLGGIMSPSIEAALASQRSSQPQLAGRLDQRPVEEMLGSHPALGQAFSAREPERAHLYQSLGRMGTADPAVMLPRLIAVSHDEHEAARLQMPVLCIVGDQDPLIPPAGVRALTDLLPDARVVEISG
ncbi:MAG: alpha/beta fold hydrolase, partial [Acidimicrobiales bacterium]